MARNAIIVGEAYNRQTKKFRTEHAEFQLIEEKIDCMTEELEKASATQEEEKKVVTKKQEALQAVEKQQSLAHSFTSHLSEFQQFTRSFMPYPDMFLHGPICLKPYEDSMKNIESLMKRTYSAFKAAAESYSSVEEGMEKSINGALNCNEVGKKGPASSTSTVASGTFSNGANVSAFSPSSP